MNNPLLAQLQSTTLSLQPSRSQTSRPPTSTTKHSPRARLIKRRISPRIANAIVICFAILVVAINLGFIWCWLNLDTLREFARTFNGK